MGKDARGRWPAQAGIGWVGPAVNFACRGLPRNARAAQHWRHASRGPGAGLHRRVPHPSGLTPPLWSLPAPRFGPPSAAVATPPSLPPTPLLLLLLLFCHHRLCPARRAELRGWPASCPPHPRGRLLRPPWVPSRLSLRPRRARLLRRSTRMRRPHRRQPRLWSSLSHLVPRPQPTPLSWPTPTTATQIPMPALMRSGIRTTPRPRSRTRILATRSLPRPLLHLKTTCGPHLLFPSHSRHSALACAAGPQARNGSSTGATLRSTSASS